MESKTGVRWRKFLPAKCKVVSPILSLKKIKRLRTLRFIVECQVPVVVLAE